MYDRIVIQQRIVIISKHLQLIILKLWAIVHRWQKVLVCFLRITIGIAEVRTHKVKYYQIMLLIVLFQVVVLLQHSIVKAMQLIVSCVKQSLAKLRVVKEETSTEVVNSLTSLRLELVCDKRYVIASLAEHLWE